MQERVEWMRESVLISFIIYSWLIRRRREIDRSGTQREEAIATAISQGAPRPYFSLPPSLPPSLLSYLLGLG